MKSLKRVLGIFLSLAFVFTVAFNQPITAKAYSYTVCITLGDNADASFDKSALDEKYKDAKIVSRKLEDGKEVPFKLVLDNLSYNETITFDAAKLINVASGSKYYVKGLRVGGADDMVNLSGNTNVTLTVKANETYVAAYGVGVVIPYKVQYVDEAGNALYAEETLYAAKDEEAIVPARHIPDYSPDVVEKKVPIVADTIVQFVYKKLEPTVIYTYSEGVTTQYVQGTPTYTYEYEYIEGAPQTTTTTNTNPGVVNNRGVNINGPAANEGNGAAEAIEGEGGGAGAGEDTTTIGEGETPKSGNAEIGNGEGGTTIPPDQPPKAGEEKRLTRVLIVTIFILVLIVITALVIMYLANQKRRETIRRIEEQDEKPKRF